MSFLKKAGRKLGINRKNRSEATEHANAPPGSLQEESLALTASNSLGAQISPALPDVSRPNLKTIVGAQRQRTDQSSQQNSEEHLSQQGNHLSISGGTFTNVGRDLNFSHIHNQYITEESKDIKLFEVLSPVPAAHDCEVVSSKVSECFAGTRQQLLQEIETWRTAGSVPIFILDGIAGIGKSTIVKSVCAQADAERRLAASWFFSRDEQDRKTTRGFVRTLAYQLAAYHPTLRNRISQVLKDQPDILQKAIRMQFEALVHEPLRGVFENQSEAHTISIDAMDECNLLEAIELLSVLLTAIPQHPGLRLLVTCRPERPFRLLFQKYRGPRVFHLHQLENSVAQADIRLYVNHRLSPAQIDEALPDLLPPLWRASPEEKDALVQMAGKLFIVASTAINFILDPIRLAPAKQMAQLLDVKAGAGLAGSSMDGLYIQVLRAAVPEPVGDWFEHYQAIVGSIVVAADVLPVQSLASLLGTGPNDIVRALSHLHSLIAPTRDSDAFHIHHKSFTDLVTDKSRCAIDSRFFIQASACHFHLAQNCLRIMIQMLKQNICELPRSNWDIAFSKLPSSTKNRIPPELAYACAYWTLHIREGLPHLIGHDDLIGQLKTFVNQHLLSWLEVLAWTSRFDTAWGDVSLLVESITKLLPTAGGVTLDTLLHIANVLGDLLRFISLHPELPQNLPMHIYLSVLPFAPSESKIWDLYAKSALNATQSVVVVSGLKRRWDPIFATIQEKSPVRDMDLAPCGTMVATKTANHVRLYHAKSGQQLRSFRLEEQNRSVYSVAFSPDSQYIAAAGPGGIQVWCPVSGGLIGGYRFPSSSTQLFDNSSPTVAMHPEHDFAMHPGHDFYSVWNPHTMQITSLIFNPDELSISAGTVDGRIFLWRIGEPEAVLLPADRSFNHPCDCLPEGTRVMCWIHRVTILVALPDSPILVGVTQSAVHFWDRITHKHLKAIPRCAAAPYIGPVSISPDKTMLAIDSDTFVISIHSAHTQNRLCNLSGHQGRITTTAFAPPSPSRPNQLCSASEDRTVRLWDITTASQLKNIQTLYVLTDTVFSATLGTFVLAERAKRGRMIRLVGDHCIAYGPSHFRGQMPKGLKLSADGSILASLDKASIMVASVCDFIDPVVHADTLGLSQPFQFGYLPSGELVALYRADNLESRLEFSEGVTSLNVTVSPRCVLAQTSPDMSRVAIIEDNTSLWIHNLRSGRQESCLPLPPLHLKYESQQWDRVAFSWDSGTVYLKRPGGEFYAARLPPVPGSPKDVLLSDPIFSKIDAPAPHHACLHAVGLPNASQLHYLTEASAWALLSDEKTWTRMQLPSLPFQKIRRVAYSPSGGLIAIAIWQETGGSDAVDIDIQIRCLPDYDLILTLRDHQHNELWELQFIGHLPHILVASSSVGFTSWDVSTGQNLGSSSSLSRIFVSRAVHPYNGLDFLCVMESPSKLVVLVAVQLRGPDLPAVVETLCILPPHLSSASAIRVNPLHPHIVALSTRKGIIQIDISRCPLPFTL
ncbi:WD40-repeat-containing domain protein [Coprinopsis sp. MPI-PUGE-AT-0042]|nr:WD40-repeat-containing domain protein [Coprinopsis sp. MPI-PUGE-AT-0042]